MREAYLSPVEFLELFLYKGLFLDDVGSKLVLL